MYRKQVRRYTTSQRCNANVTKNKKVLALGLIRRLSMHVCADIKVIKGLLAASSGRRVGERRAADIHRRAVRFFSDGKDLIGKRFNRVPLACFSHSVSFLIIKSPRSSLEILLRRLTVRSFFRKNCTSCKCPREAHDICHEEWVSVRSRLGLKSDDSSGSVGVDLKEKGLAWAPPGLPSNKVSTLAFFTFSKRMMDAVDETRFVKNQR